MKRGGKGAEIDFEATHRLFVHLTTVPSAPTSKNYHCGVLKAQGRTNHYSFSIFFFSEQRVGSIPSGMWLTQNRSQF